MQTIYHWPTAAEIYPDREHQTRRLKRLRFTLRSVVNYLWGCPR